ncbi:UNVERIFIED_CONTAM: hypothetical protein HDU68_000549 [Siphonaria sp. JEL0065]|nr:hypothetical protein HDU68_000549 [Siphonaria sp. JEL0065]
MDPSKWSIDRVQVWLRTLKLESQMLEKVQAAFEANDIDGDSLLSLDLDLLKSELGIDSFGLRKKLVAAINELRRLQQESRPLPVQLEVEYTTPVPSVPHLQPPMCTIQKNTQIARYCDAFTSSPYFLWTSVDLHPKLSKESHLFELNPSTSTSAAIHLSGDLESDFFFIRSRRKSGITLELSRLNRPRVAIQRKVKRLLKSSNLIVFDQESVENDKDIGRFYRRVDGATGNSLRILGVWQTPSRDASAKKICRVFKRFGRAVIDFVDNSGRYTDEPTTASTIPNTQIQTGFGGTHSSKRNETNIKEADDDEVLPLYGDSDTDLYETDSEWERDIREAERIKLAGGSTPKKSRTSNKQKQSQEAQPQQQQQQNQTGPVFDEEVNLDVFMDVDNDTSKPALSTSLQPGVSSFLSATSPFPLSLSTAPPSPPPPSLIHALIQTKISTYETDWTQTTLPKILPRAHWIYKTRNTHSTKYKTQLADLTVRRIPKMIQAIVESSNGNLRDIEKCCENMRLTIYRRMELEWRVGVVEAGGPPDESVPRPKKRVRGGSVGGGDGNDGDMEVNEDKEDEDEHWSDFLASDDDDVHMRGGLSDEDDDGDGESEAGEEELVEVGVSRPRRKPVASAKGTASSQPRTRKVSNEDLAPTVANPQKTVEPSLEETEKTARATEFHQRYLSFIHHLETAPSYCTSSIIDLPPAYTLLDFRLFQEYAAFLIQADRSIYYQRKENYYGLWEDFELMVELDLAKEFLEWRPEVTVKPPAASTSGDTKGKKSDVSWVSESSKEAASKPGASFGSLKGKLVNESNGKEAASDFSDVDMDLLMNGDEPESGGESNEGAVGSGSSQVRKVGINSVTGRIRIRKRPATAFSKQRNGDSESSSDDDDDEEEDTGAETSENDGHLMKGRKELRPIAEDSPSVNMIRANRKKQVDEINKRAQKQIRKMNRANKAAKKRGEVEKIVINLGHDDSEQPIYVDDFLARHLKPHQISGIQFLWRSIIMIKDNEDEGIGHQGCILAHAMGLGKTLQTITFIYTLQREVRENNPCIPEHLKRGGILVVCPAIVVENWANEINKWIPPRKRDEILGGIFSFNSVQDSQRINQLESWNERNGVFIISYQLLRYALVAKRDEALAEAAIPETEDPVRPSDAGRFYEYLISPGPAFVVCDESHVIKNPSSGISLFINNVKTRSRLCLTGYPLQNNLEEYHAMIDFVSPGFLGTIYEFRNQYQHPITNGFFADSTEGDKVHSKQRLFVLVNIIEPLICRMNDDILKDDLPEKNEYIITVRLTPVQYRLYNRYLEHVRRQDMGKGIISKFGSLQTILNHPLAFKMAVESTKTTVEDGQDVVDTSTNRFRREIVATEENIDWQDSALSGKLLLAMEIVKLSSEVGDKVLIFSRSIPTISLLKAKLETQFKIQILTGSTTQSHRQRLIDDFNDEKNGFNAFIISTVAGGIGVNLTAANRVIIFDHGWNPSHENQAISRSYRYGQSKCVYVYRLLTFGAFEEKLFMNNVHKITLASQVVDQKHIEKTAIKTQMRQYFIAPPADPVTELHPDAHFQDSVVESIVHSNPDLAMEIIKIESHEDFVKEIEDDLTEGQKSVALDALEKERFRRKNKLPFVETGRTANALARVAAAETGSSTSAVVVGSMLESLEGVSSSSAADLMEEEELPVLALLLEKTADTFHQSREEDIEEDDTMLNLLAEGFDQDDF